MVALMALVMKAMPKDAKIETIMRETKELAKEGLWDFVNTGQRFLFFWQLTWGNKIVDNKECPLKYPYYREEVAINLSLYLVYFYLNVSDLQFIQTVQRTSLIGF